MATSTKELLRTCVRGCSGQAFAAVEATHVTLSLSRSLRRNLKPVRSRPRVRQGRFNMFDDKHYNELLQLVRTARGDGCMM
eukprot:5630112-Heterocapsa_arctica.AAC.1